MRRGNVGPSLGAARSVHCHIAQRRPIWLVGHGDEFARHGITLWMRGETAFKRPAEVRAGDALQVVVQFDRQLTSLHDSEHTAPDERDVGVHRRLTVAWPWNWGFAQGRGRVHAHREAAAIPFRTPAAQAQAMHKARPREPMVEGPIHGADRAWADAQEPAFQLIWDATTGLEAESGGLAGHRGEVAAEVRIPSCTVRGSQLCRGVFGHTDLLRCG